MGNVDDESPASVWLASDYFRAQPVRIPWRTERPCAMQQGQTFAGLDCRPRLEFHERAACEKTFKCVADRIDAGDLPAAGNKYCARLVECHYCFEIPAIEGALEKDVNVLWGECWHWLD
jgi:hypothetical protein